MPSREIGGSNSDMYSGNASTLTVRTYSARYSLETDQRTRNDKRIPSDIFFSDPIQEDISYSLSG
jgi:hypothetical protein